MVTKLMIDKSSMAIRIGELRAVAAAIEAAAGALDCGGDLGPGDISGAVSSVAEQWRHGLGEMRGKIDTMASNVDDVVDGFSQLEDASAARFTQAVRARSADPATFAQQMDSAGGQP